jgi:hypothetical protein
MNPAFEKILAPIVIGLILPLLFFLFRVNPWSAPIRYWNAALVCFGIAFLVYKFRHKGEGRIPFRTHLANFAISFVVLCVVAIVYLLVLATLYAVI